MSSSDGSPSQMVDFLDPATNERGVPYEAYRKLRDEEPASWQRSAFAGPEDRGYWLLTRHADVFQASLDSASYSSWRGTTSILEEPADRIELSRMMLLNMDPPVHTRFRRLISRSFSARAIERLEPQVRAMCKSLLDAVVARGECEFVADVASPLPARVIFALLGVPEKDWQPLVDQSNAMIDNAGTEIAMGAAMQMFMYSNELAITRRQNPGDDMVSQLLTAEVNGELLSQGEFNAFFLLLVVAGNETTRNLISGGLLTLLDNPDQLARLRRERALLPSAIEEMLRFYSPVAQFRRTANRDIELHGKLLREGDRVILAHASANRDERAFPDPDRFDITRNPNQHVAFGVGPHLCLGATLARLEARCMFDELLARIDDIELAGPVSRARSNLINGIKSMPIRFRALG